MVDLIMELDAQGPLFREAVEYVVAYHVWIEEAANAYATHRDIIKSFR